MGNLVLKKTYKPKLKNVLKLKVYLENQNNKLEKKLLL